MAWDAEMGVLVRHLVGDIDKAKYSDNRIEEAIVVAAQLSVLEIDFEQTYTIDIDSITISPDPTTASDKDDAFINLVSLRSACIILGGELRTSSENAVRVTDGPSSIDMTAVGEGIKETHAEMCRLYEEAKIQYKTNGLVGKVVMSPYNPGSDFVRW